MISTFKGRHHTQASKDKMSKAKKGQVAHNKGTPHTQASKDKMRAGWVLHKLKKAEQEMFLDHLNGNQDWKGLR